MILKFNARVLGIALAALLGFGSVFGAVLVLQGKFPTSTGKSQALRLDGTTQTAAGAKATGSGAGGLVTTEAGLAVAALTGPLSHDRPKPGDASENKLAFDVARISPGDPSVLAGRAGAGQVVDVLADGVVIGSATADENGNWVLVVDRWLARPDAKLELRRGVARVERREMAVDQTPTRLASTRDTGSGAGRPTAVAAANAQMMRRLDTLISEARQPGSGSSAVVDQLIAASKRPAAVEERGAGSASDNGRTRVAAVDGTPRAGAPAVVPVPIQFQFQAADFTPYGRRAAAKLLEYLKVSGQSAVSLSGHADDRGTEVYNMDLSRRRLETVQAFLRAGGYEGRLELMPMGKSQPYRGVDRSKLSIEELYQLDRRVELRIQN